MAKITITPQSTRFTSEAEREATISIPLGFLAGVYGMNFDTSTSPYNLPKLSMRYDLLFFWCLVLLIGAAYLYYVEKRN